MRNKKILNVCLILLMLLAMPVVHAHDITLAEEGTIVIPDELNAKTKIIINKDITDYKMYYQWVEMPEENYKSYMNILQAQEVYAKEENPGADSSDAAQKEYEDAIQEYENQKNKEKPVYVENEWEESKDGTVPFNKPTEGIKTEEPYVLWIKVIDEDDSENPLYEERLILYSSALTNDDIPNASTSDNIVVIGVLSAVAVAFMMISYKKSKA